MKLTYQAYRVLALGWVFPSEAVLVVRIESEPESVKFTLVVKQEVRERIVTRQVFGDVIPIMHSCKIRAKW